MDNVLLFGTTNVGAQVPFLVDDAGRLVIEVAGAQAASAQSSGEPVSASATLTPRMRTESNEPLSVYLVRVVVSNPTNANATVKIGTSPGGDDVVAEQIIEANAQEVVPIANAFPSTGTMHITTDSPEKIWVTFRYDPYVKG